MEEAVRLRERLKDKVESITVVTLGPAKASETLRTALAMGADSGVHIELPENAPSPEPLGAARALRAVIERRGKAGTGTDLVIMGKQAIDDDLGQTGQMLAALLGAAQATCASKLDVDVEKRVARVRTEIDGGAEELECSLPTVVTTDLRCVCATLPHAQNSHICDQKKISPSLFSWLCAHVRLNGGCDFNCSLDSIQRLDKFFKEPRYASLPNIMKAKKKPIEKLTPAGLGVDLAPLLETITVREPPKRVGGGKVGSALFVFMAPMSATEHTVLLCSV